MTLLYVLYPRLHLGLIIFNHFVVGLHLADILHTHRCHRVCYPVKRCPREPHPWEVPQYSGVENLWVLRHKQVLLPMDCKSSDKASELQIPKSRLLNIKPCPGFNPWCVAAVIALHGRTGDDSAACSSIPLLNPPSPYGTTSKPKVSTLGIKYIPKQGL